MRERENAANVKTQNYKSMFNGRIHWYACRWGITNVIIPLFKRLPLKRKALSRLQEEKFFCGFKALYCAALRPNRKQGRQVKEGKGSRRKSPDSLWKTQSMALDPASQRSAANQRKLNTVPLSVLALCPGTANVNSKPTLVSAPRQMDAYAHIYIFVLQGRLSLPSNKQNPTTPLMLH